MNFAGLAAGYGGIVEGEQDYADKQARNVRTQQGNMDNAIRLRQMREMDAARKAQLEIGRQAPEAYAPIAPGTTGYADAEKVAPAAPATPAAPAPIAMTTPTGGLKGSRDAATAPDRSIEISEMAKRLAAMQQSRQRVSPATWQEAVDKQTTATRFAGQRDATPARSDAAAWQRMVDMNTRTGRSAGASAPPSAQPAEPSAAEGRMAKQLSDWQSEDAARGRGQAALAAASAARGTGVDFISRVRQAESNGNMNAVGPNVPGQGTAKSDMQVMDRTSADPGFGVRAAQNDSLEERSRVGRDYAQAMLQRYNGDEAAAAAAYNWGPGNYEAWRAAGADPARLPAETRAYVARVTGGAQSVQAKLGVQTPTTGPGVNQALPNAMPATPAVAPEDTYKATEIVDLSPRAAGLAQKRMEMLGRERQTYVSLMQASYDPGEQMKLRQAILGIDAGMATADLTQLAAGAANGNREALVTLAQTTANQIGTKISVQDAGNGKVVLTVAGRQQPPVTMAQASRQFHLALSEELQKTVAAAEAKNAAEAMKQMYQGQREIAVESLKGQNALRTAAATGQQQRETKLVEGALTMAQQAAKRAGDYEYGKGQYTLRELANGQLLMYPKSGTGVKMWVPGETGGQFSTDGEWVDTNQG